MEVDPTRARKVNLETTPGDLAPVYSLSPVTITLRRFQFTGKSPPRPRRETPVVVLGVVALGQGRVYCPQSR